MCLSLKRTLDEMMQNQKTTTFSHLVKTLLQSLHDRFLGLFTLVEMTVPSSGVWHDLCFTSNLFLLSAALDPAFGFQWLQDHPGSP